VRELNKENEMSEITKHKCEWCGKEILYWKDAKEGWIQIHGEIESLKDDRKWQTSQPSRGYFYIPHDYDFCCFDCFINWIRAGMKSKEEKDNG